VDPVSRRDFWRILYDLLKEGVTIFISTAYLDEAERCHRLALMHQGRLLRVGRPEEIKRVTTGDLWELRCEPRMRARQLLKDLPGVRGLGIFGDRLHLLLEEGEKVRSQVEHFLKESGVEFGSWKKISPSLEDVFIATVENKNDRSA